MGRRVRYERPEYDDYTVNYAITGMDTVSLRNDYQQRPNFAPRWDNRAAENPLHGGDHFIAEGEKAAARANAQVKHMFFVVMGLLGAAYLLWRFGI